jgi:hypothetical protein
MVSHTSTGEWQSFEVRMRHRRAERLALRAEIAAEAGCLDDARECLAEARALVPALPAVKTAEAAIAQAEQRVAAGADSPADAPTQVAFLSRRWIPYTVAATVAMAVLAGWTWSFGVSSPASEVRLSAVPSANADVPADASAKADLSTVASADVDSSAGASAKVDPSAVALAKVEDPTPAEPERAIPPPVAPQPRQEVAPATSMRVDAVNANNARAPLPPVATMPPGVERPAPPSVVETPLSSSSRAPGAPVNASIAMPPPTPAEPPPAEPSQDAVVRNVLGRYASAYNALDVTAATRVWPGVNRGALARAFDSLASQQVSLGDCRIDVSGAKAQAHCAGRATWTPKIGSGTRSESRSWTFELARAGSDWQIVTARVQNR